LIFRKKTLPLNYQLGIVMKIVKNKKNKGYTLIEVLIVMGLILLVTVGIYQYYAKKMSIENTQLQVTYLEKMHRSLNDLYLTSDVTMPGSFLTLNNTNAITWGVVPMELQLSPTTIKNTFGGNINIFPSPAPILGQFGFAINLDRLTTKDCTNLALSDYAKKIPQVLINGVDAKTPGSIFTPANIATVTGACAVGNNNAVEFRSYPIAGIGQLPLGLPPPLTPSIYSVPTLGDVVTSAPGAPASCTGGSAWNGGFCGCPAGNIWTGNACQVVDSSPQSCQYGKGWNGVACVVLANQVAPIPPAPNPIQAPSPAITPIYTGGRYVPVSPTTPIPPVQLTAAATACTGAGGNWDGRVCNSCPDAANATATFQKSDGTPGTQTPIGANAHAVKLTWNGYRCVAPAGW
jgi:prepilin-type N-terminal cleavage/methylation domain-containing protein